MECAQTAKDFFKSFIHNVSCWLKSQAAGLRRRFSTHLRSFFSSELTSGVVYKNKGVWVLSPPLLSESLVTECWHKVSLNHCKTIVNLSGCGLTSHRPVSRPHAGRRNCEYELRYFRKGIFENRISKPLTFLLDGAELLWWESVWSVGGVSLVIVNLSPLSPLAVERERGERVPSLWETLPFPLISSCGTFSNAATSTCEPSAEWELVFKRLKTARVNIHCYGIMTLYRCPWQVIAKRSGVTIRCQMMGDGAMKPCKRCVWWESVLLQKSVDCPPPLRVLLVN